MSALEGLTITTACDANYLWGVFLMVGTLRQHGMEIPVHLLAQGFSAEQQALITQLGEVELIPLAPHARSLVTSKPDALLTARSEWIAWIDSDCVFTGDVSPMLIPPNREMQIRMRGEAENTGVYRKEYAAGEPRGGVARAVLETWRRDVGDLREPRLSTTCPSNVFVMNQRFRPFVELWRRQMDVVLSAGMTGVVDWKNRHYHQTDESVLNSLLTFSSIAPAVSPPYLLDRVEGPHIGHFVGSPKPWKRWNWRSLNWYETVLSFLGWCAAHGLRTPPLPASFQREHRAFVYARAAAAEAYQRARARAGAFARAHLLPQGRA